VELSPSSEPVWLRSSSGTLVVVVVVVVLPLPGTPFPRRGSSIAVVVVVDVCDAATVPESSSTTVDPVSVGAIAN